MTNCLINILLFLYFSTAVLFSQLYLFKRIREVEEELERLKKILVECCFRKD